MENKRLIIAVIASIVIVFAWQTIATKLGFIQSAPEQTASQTAPAPLQNIPPTVGTTTPSQNTAFGTTPSAPLLSTDSDINITTPLYTMILHANGGIVKEYRLTKYLNSIEKDATPIALFNEKTLGTSPMGLFVNSSYTWEDANWEVQGGDLALTGEETGSIVMKRQVGDITVTRAFIFYANSYKIDEILSLTSNSVQNAKIGYNLSASSFNPNAGNHNVTRAAWLINDSLTEEESGSSLQKRIVQTGTVDWLGVMDNYFMVAIAPEQNQSITLAAREIDSLFHVSFIKDQITVSPGAPQNLKSTWWFGPKDRELLEQAAPVFGESISLGWFAVIAKPLSVALKFLYDLVGNYGIAILILTFLLKILFWPLSQKSFRSMEKMKKLQPEMQKIREKHADNKEEMNKEIMGLYKTYKVNPASGCLPMVIQIPVFFGLYKALLNTLDLRHASFIEKLPFTDYTWLADLSAQDPLYIAPVAMGASMLLLQKLTPAAGDPMQAKIMMLMPIVFTWLFLSLPSGLVVYWLANNILTILQQWLLLRKVK